MANLFDTGRGRAAFDSLEFVSGGAQSKVTIRAFQAVTAFVEAGAGLALLGLPSVTTSLLFGTPLDSFAAVSVARIGGAAIFAIAIVCFLARGNAHGLASHGMLVALLFYNLVVAGVLAFASFGHDLHGVLLWPAAAFHFAMAAWCGATLQRNGEGIKS
jgi:hypothetical protein